MANIPMDGMLIVVMRIAFAEEICIKVTIVRPNVYRIANNRQYFFSPLPFKPFDLSDIDRKQMQRYDIRVQSTENRPAQTSSESEFLFHCIHLFVVSCAHIYHCFRCSIVFNSDASGFLLFKREMDITQSITKKFWTLSRYLPEIVFGHG